MSERIFMSTMTYPWDLQVGGTFKVVARIDGADVLYQFRVTRIVAAHGGSARDVDWGLCVPGIHAVNCGYAIYGEEVAA